ncbi:hypothetical protein L6259_00850 [Candidatus Parcubacteria bacterium]|nr:hypothetical protein [Patescibacteria group bacterium]MCG2693821.1 hypothetical protein [Candidatus Parcubacteria bacterium]
MLYFTQKQGGAMFDPVQYKTINLEEGVLFIGQKGYCLFNEKVFCELLDRESRNGWVYVGVVKSVSEKRDFGRSSETFPHTILMKRELPVVDPNIE